MKKILLTLLICAVSFQTIFAERPTGVIYRTTKVPIIDGQIDDIWATAIQYNIDKKFLNEEPTFGDVGTTYWKALWDDNGMYILVVVNDDVWYPYWAGSGFSFWEYDKVELYFDTNSILKDGVGAGAGGNTGHTQIAPGPIEGFVDGTMQTEDIGIYKIKYAYNVTDPKWYTEYFIPWDCIPDQTGARFDKSGMMGFDIYLVDNDPGNPGRKRAVWANIGAIWENWGNMDDAGHLIFKDKVEIEGTYEKTVITGESVHLSATTNFIDPGTLTYSWSPATGLDRTDIQNPVATPAQNTIYTVTITSSNGETGEASTAVKVVPFSATSEDQNTTCGKTAHLFVTTNYTGTGTLTYDWQPADKVDNPGNPNPVASVSKTTDFTVKVTTPNGIVAEKMIRVNVLKTDYQPALCLVSVDAGSKNVLVWTKSDDPTIQDYLIFRESLIQTDFYDLVGSVSATEESSFTDQTSNALVQSNKYKIAARDGCGFVTNQSLPHKTIHLSINKGQGNAWNLIWEPYDGFAVSSYKIYRGNTPTDLTLIGSTAGSANSFTDFGANEGTVYYQIEVLAPYSCSSLKSTTYYGSRSNIATNNPDATGIVISNVEWAVYPVPVKSTLFLNKDLSCVSEIGIFTIDGKAELILKQPFNASGIDIGKLPKGTHLLKIADESKVSVLKFIKE